MHFVFSFSISGLSNKAIPRTYQSPLVLCNYTFYSHYNTVWIANMEIGLDTNNSYKEVAVYNASNFRTVTVYKVTLSGCLKFYDFNRR